MRKGEKGILILSVVLIVGLGAVKIWQNSGQEEPDRGIPYYSTAPAALQSAAGDLIRKYRCRECHTIWSVRDMTANVPAPALDGIGSLRDEAWLRSYLSAPNPQAILPSRLKPQYRMPSFADIPAADLEILITYLASLKVQDWYLEETRKAEQEKLTGRPYVSSQKKE